MGIEQVNEPAAEDMTAAVGIGGHRHDPDGQLALTALARFDFLTHQPVLFRSQDTRFNKPQRTQRYTEVIEFAEFLV